MTLINKERLLEYLRERCPLDWDDEGEEYGMLLRRIIIDEQPTVEAIPVEWLKSHMITHGEVVNGDYFEDEALELNMYVSDLIGRWQAEQRKEE